MTNTEMVSLAKDIVVGVSAIVVAGVAIYGLNRWQKELAGKAKFEIARNLILLGFQLEADFESARSPFTWSGKSADRERKDNETKDESFILNEWHARKKRLI